MSIHSEVSLITNSSSELFVVKLYDDTIRDYYNFRSTIEQLSNGHSVFGEVLTVLNSVKPDVDLDFGGYDWDDGHAVLRTVFARLKEELKDDFEVKTYN